MLGYEEEDGDGGDCDCGELGEGGGDGLLYLFSFILRCSIMLSAVIMLLLSKPQMCAFL